jgi:hypothetical protein
LTMFKSSSSTFLNMRIYIRSAFIQWKLIDIGLTFTARRSGGSSPYSFILGSVYTLHPHFLQNLWTFLFWPNVYASMESAPLSNVTCSRDGYTKRYPCRMQMEQLHETTFCWGSGGDKITEYWTVPQ